MLSGHKSYVQEVSTMSGQVSGSIQPLNNRQRQVCAGVPLDAKIISRPKLGEILIEAELISDSSFL